MFDLLNQQFVRTVDFSSPLLNEGERVRKSVAKKRGGKLPLFIGILVIVALLINVFFFAKASQRRETKVQEQRRAAAAAEAEKADEKLAQEKKDAEANRIQNETEAKVKAEETRKKVAQEAAAEHASFLARYLNSDFTRNPGVATIGVAVESENGIINPRIADALAKRLNSEQMQFLNSFFKPDFIADRYLSNLFSGDTRIFAQLDLTNFLNGVLIGRQTIDYSTNSGLENTITANLRLELMLLPIGSPWQSQSWALSANGVGFKNFDARQQAEDHIIRQIANDPTMSLSNLSPNK